MAKPKSLFTGPWYPWYVDDVLTSERVELMTLTEEGAYRRALDKVWKEGSLPADAKLCAKRIGKGCTEKMAAAVLEMFEPMPGNPDRVINKKLEAIRKDQKNKFEKKSKAGKEAMRKRWKRNSSGDSSVITHGPSVITNKTEQDLKEKSLNPSESVRVPVREIFLGTVTSQLAKRLDLKTLPAKLEWERQADWAYQNSFTADQFLECYDLLTRQHWRDGPVKPKHVVENLPNLQKLRNEIERQTNGTSIQNGTKGSKRTDADILKTSAEQFTRDYGDDPS